ncbi:uncharacterized protein LOC123307663 [Coccinella septempunctata]|uniref:uncharacterized protein LOC123307663 n=1 Tax=Coccinella septempunctata TaxID=41139 RepID=UPI001D073A01|nr:uncharacterized protein LOC123307663 [Coccinella septempunctata]
MCLFLQSCSCLLSVISRFKMASKHVIRLSEVINFFKDEDKLVKKGENAVESGHVIHMVFDSDLHVVRGKVHASMRDRQYNVEIEFDIDWSVKSGKCDCPRGQLRCHHMAALLLFARDNISVTDKECAWNKSKQSQEKYVKKLRDMYPAKPHRSTDRNLTEEEIKVFKNKLSVFDGAVGFSWLLADEISSEESFIINVEDILFSQEYLIAQNRTEFFEDKIKLEENDANKIAELTIGQSENAKWLLARKNRLTASNFAVVLAACSRQRYPPSLFKRLSGAYILENIKAIQWGKLHEKKRHRSAGGSTWC